MNNAKAILVDITKCIGCHSCEVGLQASTRLSDGNRTGAFGDCSYRY